MWFECCGSGLQSSSSRDITRSTVAILNLSYFSHLHTLLHPIDGLRDWCDPKGSGQKASEAQRSCAVCTPHS